MRWRRSPQASCIISVTLGILEVGSFGPPPCLDAMIVATELNWKHNYYRAGTSMPGRKKYAERKMDLWVLLDGGRRDGPDGAAKRQKALRARVVLRGNRTSGGRQGPVSQAGEAGGQAGRTSPAGGGAGGGSDGGAQGQPAASRSSPGPQGHRSGGLFSRRGKAAGAAVQLPAPYRRGPIPGSRPRYRLPLRRPHPRGCPVERRGVPVYRHERHQRNVESAVPQRRDCGRLQPR